MLLAQPYRPAYSRTALVARRRRRGITAMLAMLFLVLFSALAVGFYASVTTAAQVSHNDQRVTQAYLAAESGMDFMRYQLARVSIPPGTAQVDVMEELYKDLKAQLQGTANFAGKDITKTANIILIPADRSKIISTSADKSTGFRATITEWAGEIVVKIEGRYGSSASVGRAFTLDFTRASKPTTVFDFAVASKGKISMQKGTVSGPTGREDIASILSGKETSPAISVSGGTIGGNLNIVANGLASITGGTVHGTSNQAMILSKYTKVVDEKPEFPVIDTSVFKPYAVNTFNSGGGSVLKNVRIPAGTNPKFTGGVTIQGILYVESPNTVTFRGNTQMQGMIVFENAGTPATNVIDMSGNFSHGALPNGAEFDTLRSITGIAVLAPTTDMKISGSTDSMLVGNVILGQFHNGGSADWTIDQGTLMTLDAPAAGTDTAVFNGKTVKFLATGAANQPTAGMVYSTFFKPNPISYQEVSP